MAEEQPQEGSPGADPNDGGSRRRTLWERIVGDGSHLGFWTLPVFIATALGGAVIAGALAQVYYGQQVAQLEEESAAARSAAERAAEDIEEARQEALAAIDAQVDDVRSALQAARPLEDPATAGIVALTAELTPPPAPSPSPSPSPPSPQPSPSPGAAPPGQDSEAQGAPLAAANVAQLAATTEQPADESEQEPPPPTEDAETRDGVGFVVAAEGGTSFVATSFAVVADPRDPDGVAPAVEVAASSGRARGVVHAWDEQRGVAIVRVDLGDLPILPWRPADTPVEQGSTVVLAAVTQRLIGVQLPGRVGAVTDEAVLTDLPVDPAFDGAPLLDPVGRVVGIQAMGAEPLGPGVSGAVAAQVLCVELINGCDQLEEDDPTDAPSPGDGPEGG